MSSEFSEGALKALLAEGKAAVGASNKLAIMPLLNGREFALVKADGSVEIRDLPEPPRKHSLNSVEDVCLWAISQQFAGHPVTIYIGDECIVATPDDRRFEGDRASYSFVTTDQFDEIVQFSERNSSDAFDQKTLLTALRTDYRNSFASEKERDALIKSLRNVEAKQASQITQGGGTYVAGMMTAEGSMEKWPERLSMKVRVFDDPCLLKDYVLDVVFEVDAGRKTFHLWPTKQSIVAVRNEAHESVVDLVRNSVKDTDNINVYLGRPER